LIGGGFAMGTFLCVFRRRAERRCGPLHFIFPFKGGQWARWSWTMIVSGLMTLATAIFMFSVQSPMSLSNTLSPAIANSMKRSEDIMYKSSLVMFASTGVILTQATLSLLWRRVIGSIEICENGVIVNGVRCYPWSKVRHYQISQEGSVLCLKTGLLNTEWEVTDESRETLVNFFSLKGIRCESVR
jgi:hypothetical protein